MAIDSYFDGVALLLHGDGAHASTTFTDSSPRPKTVTPYGGAQISTTQSKFGGAAMAFNGSSAYLTTPDNVDFSLGADPWTIEFWFYEVATNSASTLVAKMSANESTDANMFLVTSTAGKLKVAMYTTGGYSGRTATLAHTLNTWHHFAACSSGSSMSMYLDGALAASSIAQLGPFADTAGLVSIGAQLNVSGLPASAFVYFNGFVDDLRITKGVARYTGAFAVPAEAYPNQGAPAFSALAAVPLPATAALAWCDFAAMLGNVATHYVMDLLTPTGPVRVPISSWQATLQTSGSNYVQCVVPACTQWVPALSAASEFLIYRQAATGAGVINYEMARAPLEQVVFDQGAARHTCTLSGYSPGFAVDANPPAVYDRALDGVRSISRGSSGTRVRAAVDWLLRPGHRAFAGGVPFVVDYINYYAPSGGDGYMDVGARA